MSFLIVRRDQSCDRTFRHITEVSRSMRRMLTAVAAAAAEAVDAVVDVAAAIRA